MHSAYGNGAIRPKPDVAQHGALCYEPQMKFVFPLPRLIELKATMQPWERGVTGADQTRMVKQAEVIGYDMVSISEHFVIPNEHVDLSGPHHFNATAAQGYLCGATETIRVNSCITILPAQHPIVLAKALATIDWLSSGRLTVTFGVGWLEREFDMIGVPFKERGRISDEYIAAMIELWTSDNPSFDGRYVSFSDVAFEPKPLPETAPAGLVRGTIATRRCEGLLASAVGGIRS